MTEEKKEVQKGRQRPGESDWETVDRIMDNYEKAELQNIKEKFLENKKDFVICIVGVKGTGKSTLGLQMCKWIDPTFNADRVYFYGDNFLKGMRDIKPGQSILFDEAILSLNRRNSMTNINKKLMTAFNIFRKKAGFIVLCIPHIENLDSSISTKHVFGLVRVRNYSKRNDRQLWQWYSRKRLRKIVNDKYNYGASAPNRMGVFYDFRPFEEEYEAKKDKAINHFLGVSGVSEISSIAELPDDDIHIEGKKLKLMILERLLKLGLKQEEAGDIIGVSQQTVSVYKRRGMINVDDEDTNK